MIELFEKTILAGVGAISLSQKKAEEMLQEMKEQMNISEDEGRKILKRLESIAEENRSKLEKAAEEEVRKTCERLGIITKDELATLKGRITKLENRIKELEK
ncbi:MAG: phasin superfamily protein [Desulfuromonas sp.]|nr:MAG: phasin superfamily protein [Desulfuromonas sp.]